MAEQDEWIGPPPKRMRRMDNESHTDAAWLDAKRIIKASTQSLTSDDVSQKELAAEISTFVNPTLPGFSGILKQRYTDFLVNEVLPDGKVVHLESSAVPKFSQTKALNANGLQEADPEIHGDRSLAHSKGEAPTVVQETNGTSQSNDASQQLNEEERATLAKLFGKKISQQLQDLYNYVLSHPDKKPRDVRPVKSDKIADKEDRKQAHQAIRQLFNSKLDSKTSDDDVIVITAAASSVKPRGGFEHAGAGVKNKRGWADLGGEYLHFTLYKENRDTMEAVSFLAAQLKVPTKTMQFGGTKDRRAVTVQRVSCYRIKAEQLAAVDKRLRGAKVGDYKYLPHGMELGEIGGNEFCISLRDCRFPEDEALNADDRLELARSMLPKLITKFQNEGFINYYGLQRFGAYASSTDQVGIKLLQGNLKGAVEDILVFSQDALDASSAANTDHTASTKLISADDISRASAISTWLNDHDGDKALRLLPRKFSAESNIIRKLSSGGRAHHRHAPNANDYQGALMAIPRPTRMMYVHAYQSLVWNHVASARWRLYGARVIPGDLVLVSEHRDKEPAGDQVAEVDEAGEPIVLPAADDKAPTADDDAHERARVLTEQEIQSGAYSIFDIVLPLPGYDVVYPANDTEKLYREFMASERGGGMDPYKMHRSWKDISLSGGYRKLLARPNNVDFEVKKYVGKNTQLVETDLERLGKRAAVGASDGEQEAANGERSITAHAGTVPEAEDNESRVAVIVKMRLGSGTYATMALRELMKSGLQQFQPDYAGR